MRYIDKLIIKRILAGKTSLDMWQKKWERKGRKKNYELMWKKNPIFLTTYKKTCCEAHCV